MAPPKTAGAPRGTIHGSTPHSILTFTIRAVPLPDEITTFLQSNVAILRTFQKEHSNPSQDATEAEDDETEGLADSDVQRRATVKPGQFWESLKKLCVEAGPEWAYASEHIWAFGPNRVGPNLLIDRTGSGKS